MFPVKWNIAPQEKKRGEMSCTFLPTSLLLFTLFLPHKKKIKIQFTLTVPLTFSFSWPRRAWRGEESPKCETVSVCVFAVFAEWWKLVTLHCSPRHHHHHLETAAGQMYSTGALHTTLPAPAIHTNIPSDKLRHITRAHLTAHVKQIRTNKGTWEKMRRRGQHTQKWRQRSRDRETREVSVKTGQTNERSKRGWMNKYKTVIEIKSEK